jgi:hypothetical protein
MQGARGLHRPNILSNGLAVNASDLADPPRMWSPKMPNLGSTSRRKCAYLLKSKPCAMGKPLSIAYRFGKAGISLQGCSLEDPGVGMRIRRTL